MMTAEKLNRAVSAAKSTKLVVDLMDGTANRTGIFRNKKFVDPTVRAAKDEKGKATHENEGFLVPRPRNVSY